MNNRTELIANIILIAVGVICGTIFYIVQLRELSPVFFAIALASILYQFLGGIGDGNNFNLGALKFGGAAAVLIGFMYFLKSFVFVQSVDESKLNIDKEDWIPISAESGKSIEVTISNGKDTRVFPDSTASRNTHSFTVTENEAKHFNVKVLGYGESIGSFQISNLTTSTLFNEISIDDEEKRIKIFTLYPDDPDQNSTADFEELSLPFEIQHYNKSLFRIRKDDEALIDGFEVVPRTAYLVPLSPTSSYVVFLEQAANNVSKKYPDRYSKWLVKRITLELSN